ncbi:MAG: hypothetical protein LBQ81_02030 [Zoogloeaceae bacterium]|jgi:hypothetical protein|nr:hypothetical protein [Zoogloeaceae bacterium]
MEKKQNWFADMEDVLNDDGQEAFAYIVAFVSLLFFWAYFGTFWGALLIAVLSGSLIGGVGVMIMTFICAIFARRDQD